MANAIVLAGRANEGAFTEVSSVSNESLLEINGIPMLSYVLSALEDAKSIERIVVVGPYAELKGFENERIKVVQSKDNIIDNVKAGLEVLPEEDVLISTSDIPLIEGYMIENFLMDSYELDAELFYPIIKESDIKDKYTDVQRTYVKLKDDIFTGGNMFLVRWQALQPGLAIAEEFFKYRKSPLKLARLLGVSFILRLITKTATISMLEKKVSSMIGHRGRAVVVRDVEIGIDVDKIADLEFAERVIGS